MSVARTLGAVCIVGLFLISQAGGIEPVNPNLDPAAREVLSYLDSV